MNKIYTLLAIFLKSTRFPIQKILNSDEDLFFEINFFFNKSGLDFDLEQVYFVLKSCEVLDLLHLKYLLVNQHLVAFPKHSNFMT